MTSKNLIHNLISEELNYVTNLDESLKYNASLIFSLKDILNKEDKPIQVILNTLIHVIDKHLSSQKNMIQDERLKLNNVYGKIKKAQLSAQKSQL